MSEESTSSSLPQGPGALIEAARRKQGLHIAALAAQLKVSTARLEALEREQWSALPDATNARALATAVCRALRMDPAPVLAGMPRANGAELDRVSVGLNEPVRSGHGLALPRWALPLALLLLIGAAVVLALWPRTAVEPQAEPMPPLAQEASALEPASAASSAAAPELVAATASQEALTVAASPVASQAVPPAVTTPAVPTPVSPAPVLASAPVALPQPVPAGAALLEIRAASGESWVSVVDASGSTLASRLLLQGESLSLQPQAPVRLVLGNAPALSLNWRGQAQALEGYEQRRVARLELK